MGKKPACLLGVEVTQQCPRLKTYYAMNYLESTVKVGEAVGRLSRGNVSKIVTKTKQRGRSAQKLRQNYSMGFFSPLYALTESI